MLAAMPADQVSKERNEARRATASDGPPRLRLHVGHHLKVLMVLNVLPLFGVAWLWWQWRAGHVTLRSMSEESKTTLIVVLVCGITFAVIAWFVMPVARWLRDYPLWHVRHGASLLWWIPTALGAMAWCGLGLLGMVSALTALALLGTGIVRLLRG